MNQTISTFDNWFVIVAVILLVIFIILLIIWFFMASGTASVIVIILAIIFLILAIALFAYFWFFAMNVPSTPPPSGSGTGGTGPSVNFIRFGDTVQLRSVEHNQFASPCGTLNGGCGEQVSLRSDASFNSNGGSAAGLRSWLISGGASGTNITYGSTIKLLSLTLPPGCDNCQNVPMAICINVNVQIPAVQVTNNFFTGSDSWVILKDSTSSNTTNFVQYTDIVNLQNSTFVDDENLATYLAVCIMDAENCPNDASGVGCGQLLDVNDGIPSPPKWSFVKL